MKKGMLIILIVTIFTIGSSYRFIQLNKNISNDKKYEKVKNNEIFDKCSIFIPKSTNSVRNKGYIDTVFKILLHLKKFFSPIS